MSGFTLTLTRDSVERILGIAAAVSKDQGRPTLTGVQITVEDGSMRFVATDSYRLGIIYSKGVTGHDKVEGHGEELVNWAALERALRYFLSEMKWQRPDLGKAKVVITQLKDGLMMTGIWPGIVGSVLYVPFLDATFPRWEQLFGGQPWRASEIGHNPHYEGTLPLLNAHYLSDVTKLTGGARKFSNMDNMVQITPTGDYHGGHLKPWLFSATAQMGVWEYTYLLMPVRSPDERP